MTRKICFIILVSILFVGFPMEVNASNGRIDPSIIQSCSGRQYGYHGEDNHWHQVNEETKKAKGANLGTDWSCEKNTENVILSRCIDGDTAEFILDEKKITVRFLAIDTPETKHPTKGVEPYGKEASDYTCKTLTEANHIHLEFDASSTKTDKYNRYLAWIWADNRMIQEELIKQGLAKVAYLYGDYKYTKELEQVQQTAQSRKINIWSDDTVITSSKEEFIEDEEGEEYIESNNEESKQNSKELIIDDTMENLLVFLLVILIFIIYLIHTSLKNKKK